VSTLNSQTTSKDIANSVSKFGGILFTPIWLTDVVCYASGTMKVRLSFSSQNVAPPPPNPSTNTEHMQTLSNCAFFPADEYGCDTACFDYPLLWSSLWLEISSLAYEAKSNAAHKFCQWRTVPI